MAKTFTLEQFREWGRKGGSVKSEAKAKASRSNAEKARSKRGKPPSHKRKSFKKGKENA